MTEPRGQTVALAETVIQEHCKQLHLPTISGQCVRLAEQAEREHHGYLGYRDALLQAELEERERNTVARRLKDAHLPRVKTLDEFDFSQAPAISPTQIQALAEGSSSERA
jgi:DNA replication protein DnaC